MVAISRVRLTNLTISIQMGIDDFMHALSSLRAIPVRPVLPRVFAVVIQRFQHPPSVTVSLRQVLFFWHQENMKVFTSSSPKKGVTD